MLSTNAPILDGSGLYIHNKLSLGVCLINSIHNDYATWSLDNICFLQMHRYGWQWSVYTSNNKLFLGVCLINSIHNDYGCWICKSNNLISKAVV